MTILHRYLPQLRKQSAGCICPSCQFYSSILEERFLYPFNDIIQARLQSALRSDFFL